MKLSIKYKQNIKINKSLTWEVIISLRSKFTRPVILQDPETKKVLWWVHYCSYIRLFAWLVLASENRGLPTGPSIGKPNIRRRIRHHTLGCRRPSRFLQRWSPSARGWLRFLLPVLSLCFKVCEILLRKFFNSASLQPIDKLIRHLITNKCQNFCKN